MKGKSFYTLLILFIIILVVLFIPGYFIWLKLTKYFKADNIINPRLVSYSCINFSIPDYFGFHIYFMVFFTLYV